MEFEWNIYPGFTALQLVQEAQKFMNKMSDPDQFQGRIISMSMFNDILNSEKADTQSSEPRVHCLEERSKAMEVENYLYTSVPMEIRLKLFFAQLFLLISSVSTEQSQIGVMNTESV